jgi:PhnB protein
MTVETLIKTTEAPKTSQKREGLQSITPHLVCAGAAEAIEFYQRAFGAVELMRLPGRDGRLMHGCIAIGGGRVMLVDEMPECGALSPTSLNGTAVTVHLYVDDVDAFVDRAVKAGATLKMPVTDMFWGDRYGVIVDPFGHSWSVATHQRDMTAEEIEEAMRKLPSCGGTTNRAAKA